MKMVLTLGVVVGLSRVLYLRNQTESDILDYQGKNIASLNLRKIEYVEYHCGC